VFKRIILGFDGSAQAGDALALTRLLASQGARSVVVSHVIPNPRPFDSRTREYVMQAQEHIHKVLDPALQALAGLRVEGRPIESTSVPRGLNEVAEEEGVSLVVIGSTHRGPLGRVVIGSVGEVLLAGAPAAVAVAPKGFAGRTTDSIETVSAGFNGSPEGRSALSTAAALAAEAGARLRVIGVHEDLMHERHSLKPKERSEGTLEEQIDEALDQASALDAERVVLSGGAVDCLAEACRDTDLLVIGSRSYGPLRHALLGSVSSKLMRCCPVPLLVVPRSSTSQEAAAPAAAGAGARS
jgi:nucleotide-binding universal stress UspA family protein